MGAKKEGRAIPPIVIDTDILIWYLRGNTHAKDSLAKIPLENRWTSQLVHMELIQGCRSVIERSFVSQLLRENFARILPVSEIIGERAVQILEQYAITTGIRLVDAFIAAQCLEEGATLFTGNVKHYKKISGLPFRRFAAE